MAVQCRTPWGLKSRRQCPSGPPASPLRVGIILAEHFTLSAFAVFIDHLRLAADEGDRSRPMHVQWSIMSGRREPVRASCGVTLQPTSGLLPPASLDYVVVVGGILHAGPQIDEATTRYLREVGADADSAHRNLQPAASFLCRSGLMEGRRSCVNWYHYQDFREAFPGHDVVADRLFVADGPRITCAGGAGSAALATHLIEQHLGRAQAQKATQVLLFDRPRQGSDAQPHPPLSEGISEPRVRRALLLMEQNLTSRPISIGGDRRGAWSVDAAARAAVPRQCQHGSGLALPATAHALCELADPEHRPLDDRHRHRDGIRRLRALLAAVQGCLRDFAVDAPSASQSWCQLRRRALASIRLSFPCARSAASVPLTAT